MSYAKELNAELSPERMSPHTVIPWKTWVMRHRTRKQLENLLRTDPEFLKRDLGLHHIAVQRECRKWFWQA